MQATPIKIDVSTGMKTVTLLVADFTPFLVLGKPVELFVTPFAEMEPDPANIVQPPTAGSAAPQPPTDSGNMPPVTGTAAYESRPESSSGPMGAANAGNPNACPVCYGHGLVKEFRGENDITGTPATCKTCGGTGIKPAEVVAAKDTGPIKACTGCDGSGSESPGKRCQRCDGTGIEPANPPATHNED